MMKRSWMSLLAVLLVGLMACGDEESSEDCTPGFDGCPEAPAGDADDENENNNSPDENVDSPNEDNNAEPEPEPEPEPTCDYPEHSARPAYQQVMPPLEWEAAYKPDGSTFHFSLKDVYCNPEYEDVETIVMVASAGWCPNCPAHARQLDSISDVFRDLGALMVWMEVEDRNGQPSDGNQAYTSVNRYIGEGLGVRVGDKETKPTPSVFRGNSLVQAFPSTFVVRTSDMRVIASSSNYETVFPALQVARYPEADWDNATNNTLETNVGAECNRESDCDSGTLASQCIASHDENGSTGWIRGYCIAIDCADDAACGEGGICINTEQNIGVCYAGCETGDDCRRGYACRNAAGFSGPRICVPQ